MLETMSQNKDKPVLSGLSESGFVKLTSDLKWTSYKGKQLHSWVYKKWASSFDEMTDLNLKERQFLKDNYKLSPLKFESKQISKDKTIKYVWKLNDGSLVESVRIPLEAGGERSEVRKEKFSSLTSHLSPPSYSACISSQVGCAVGCPFCATGTLGFKKNLKASEIVDQILAIQRDTKERISNVVFMGQGEPLLNYSEVLKAICIIRDSVGIGARHITISTSGIVPQIKKLADEKLQVTLALSLHAPDQKTREFLVPIAKKYKMNELLDSLYYYYDKTKRRITIEYVMLDGINDQIEKAKALGDLVKGLHCHVNLIPYNPIEYKGVIARKPEGLTKQSHNNLTLEDCFVGLCPPRNDIQSNVLKRPPFPKIYKFKEVLEKASHKKVTIRHERGTDINAACGQLANLVSRK